MNFLSKTISWVGFPFISLHRAVQKELSARKSYQHEPRLTVPVIEGKWDFVTHGAGPISGTNFLRHEVTSRRVMALRLADANVVQLDINNDPQFLVSRGFFDDSTNVRRSLRRFLPESGLATTLILGDDPYNREGYGRNATNSDYNSGTILTTLSVTQAHNLVARAKTIVEEAGRSAPIARNAPSAGIALG